MMCLHAFERFAGARARYRVFSYELELRMKDLAPAVTTNRCPTGWVCHAVRAPGSNVTFAPATRDGAIAWNNGWTCTVPVKYSAGPAAGGCDPLRAMVIAGDCSLASNEDMCTPRRAPMYAGETAAQVSRQTRHR
jgi:hypothetical protein